MKYVFATFLIVFLAVAVFGFIGMSHGGHNMERGCVASVLDGSLCASSALGVAIHHISAYQSIADVLISDSGKIIPYFWFAFFLLGLLFFWPVVAGAAYRFQFQDIGRNARPKFLS